jgi:hypothetical protein
LFSFGGAVTALIPHLLSVTAGFAVTGSIRKRAIWAAAQRTFDTPVISSRHIVAGRRERILARRYQTQMIHVAAQLCTARMIDLAVWWNCSPVVLPNRPVNGDIAPGHSRYSVVMAFVPGPDMAIRDRVDNELLQEVCHRISSRICGALEAAKSAVSKIGHTEKSTAIASRLRTEQSTALLTRLFCIVRSPHLPRFLVALPGAVLGGSNTFSRSIQLAAVSTLTFYFYTCKVIIDRHAYSISIH